MAAIVPAALSHQRSVFISPATPVTNGVAADVPVTSL
jgi:hypothetical protein